VSDYFREARKEAKARNRRRREEAERPEKELRLLLESEPTNPDLHVQLALMLCDSLGLGAPESTEAESIRVCFLPENRKEVREHLMIGLGLGIGDPLVAAKARFVLASLLLSDTDMRPGKPALERQPELKTIASDLLSDTKKYLRREPHSIEALNLQKSAYVLLGNQEGIGRVNLALAQAQTLRDAGLVSEPSTPQRRKARAKRKDGVELEQTAARLLSSLGLQASRTTVTGDGGIDVVAYCQTPIFSGKYIIQCKDWAKPVGEPVVRDLFGLVLSEGANKGIIITTGDFTRAARRFAEDKPIELIDGEGLRQLLRRHNIKSPPDNE